jgi:hypothetical protein
LLVALLPRRAGAGERHSWPCSVRLRRVLT